MRVEWLLHPLWVDYNLIGQLGKEVKQRQICMALFGYCCDLECMLYIHSLIATITVGCDV